MALRENRVWGAKEKLMERVLPRLPAATLAQWLQDAHTVDGIVKGLKVTAWPADPWDALHRLATQVAAACANPASSSVGASSPHGGAAGSQRRA
jgi:DNA polymerase-3 subunit delta